MANLVTSDEWVPIKSAAVNRLGITEDTGGGRANYNSLAAATALTDAPTTGADLPADARTAQISVEVQAIRVTFNGETPTAAVGILYPVGVYTFENQRDSLAKMKFIEAAASAKVSVVYFK